MNLIYTVPYSALCNMPQVLAGTEAQAGELLASCSCMQAFPVYKLLQAPVHASPKMRHRTWQR